MADQWDFEDDDDLDEGSDGGSRPASGPADLRKAYRKAVRDLKAANDQLEQQAKALRSRSIKDALAAKGLNPKLAALVDQVERESRRKFFEFGNNLPDVARGYRDFLAFQGREKPIQMAGK